MSQNEDFGWNSCPEQGVSNYRSDYCNFRDILHLKKQCCLLEIIDTFDPGSTYQWTILEPSIFAPPLCRALTLTHKHYQVLFRTHLPLITLPLSYQEGTFWGLGTKTVWIMSVIDHFSPVLWPRLVNLCSVSIQKLERLVKLELNRNGINDRFQVTGTCTQYISECYNAKIRKYLHCWSKQPVNSDWCSSK